MWIFWHLTEEQKYIWTWGEIQQAFWYFAEGSAWLLGLIYPSGWIQLDVDTNDGLLVLVDQTHQLLCVSSLHQHNRTGEGVGLSQLRVWSVFRTRREPHTSMNVTFQWFLPWLSFCTHLSSSIGIIADVKNNSSSSFVQSHAGLKTNTHTLKCWYVVRDNNSKATENIISVSRRTVYIGAVNASEHH